MSPSSRRAWIEILLYSLTSVAKRVALLAEGVDRNIVPLEQVIYCRVALLAEGVDRNILSLIRFYLSFVALLAEGVDRNLKAHKYKSFPTASPSSRRAWIEISSHSPLRNLQKVALLAEGVDRNFVT